MMGWRRAFQKNIRDPPVNGLALASQSTQGPQPVCTWSAHAPQSGSSPSPLPRRGHTLTATATAAGELFLFGGSVTSVNNRATGDLYVFSTRDFSTSLLTTSGKVPSPRASHVAALVGTIFLIYGGLVKEGDIPNNDNSLYLLDLVSREWTRVVVDGPEPGPRRFSHTTTIVGSKLFVFGGEIGGWTVNDMWTLDMNCLKSQPRWESYEPTFGSEKPLPRRRHVSVTTDDRIIIFGGSGDQRHYNDTWSFDISTRKWTELQCTGSIPSPRAGHAAILVDGVMYVFGGFPEKSHLDELIGLQLSTLRWFKFDNVGPSPHRRTYHTMASDGTRVFVLGGYSEDAHVDEMSLIYVFDTKDIKYPEPEGNAVNSNEKTTRLELEPQLSSSLAAQTERDHRIAQLSDELAKKSALLEESEANAVEAAKRAGSKLREHADRLLMQTSLMEQRDAELVEMQAKHDKLLLSRDQELSNVRAELKEKESELEAVHLRLADAEKGHTSSNELVVSRDQQVGRYEKELANVRGKLEAKESELEAVRLRLADAEKGHTSLNELVASRDQQVGRYEKELANVRGKLEAKESELEEIRSQLTEAEGLTKSKAKDPFRSKSATGSVNKDEDQLTRRLMERVRAVMEAEMASKRNEKSIEEEKCTNE